MLTRQEALNKNRTKLESSAREATREPTKVSVSGKRSFNGPAERKRDAREKKGGRAETWKTRETGEKSESGVSGRDRERKQD